MDLISSVFSIYGTVSETDRQYRLMAKKLSYELKKAEHLSQTDRVKNIPKFMVENLFHKIQQAKEHLSKIEAILTEDRISLQFYSYPRKQKIILSLPFNKTIAIVKTCIQELQKAQQDVNEYGCSSETENNGKRFIEEVNKFEKKEQTMVSLIQNDEVNDEDIEEALMGPTIEEDAAIQFTRNRYILVRIELHGPDKIINFIKEINQEFLVYKTKLHIKFEKSEKKIDQIELFSLGRVHFKPIYTKLKSVYADIDRISKQNHFVVKLKRQRVNMKNCFNQGEQRKKQEKKEEVQPSKAESDEFFSFPCTDEQIVSKQIDKVVIQRSQDKSVYICDETGEWKKINELQRQICDGQEIAPFIQPNKIPQIPDLYFKIRFQVLE